MIVAALSTFVLVVPAVMVVAGVPAVPSASASTAPSASASAASSPAAEPSLTATPIAVQSPVAPTGPGADIFAANCSGCHGALGQGGVAVPSLPYPPPPLAPAGFASLVAPMVRQGGIQMPSFARQLTEAQIQIVAQYVSQQIADPAARRADVAYGGQIYRLYCAACHSTTGRGGAMTRGRNAPDISQYPAAEALAAMILGRGNMPVFAGHALDVRQQTSVALYVDVLVHAPSPGGAGLGYLGPVPEGAVGAGALIILIFIAVWLAWKSRKAVP
jgi:ubiquinol-cytochrome c reductase cytochrome c subunit